ncbi:hypothetical protein, partial [Vibrio parahaemolyticus]|uniref:hypothetical protein n=1 Tax=Vibrio parahaemolyticus TaxID=670 RepID=UPI00116A6D0B
NKAIKSHIKGYVNFIFVTIISVNKKTVDNLESEFITYEYMINIEIKPKIPKLARIENQTPTSFGTKNSGISW